MKSVNCKSVSLLFFALFTAVTAFSQSSAEYKTKIEAMNKEMAKDMIAGNSEKLLSLYVDDAISMPSYSPMSDGLAAIKKSSADMSKSGVKYTSFEPTTLKVMVNGNMVTEIGTYKVTMTIPNMPNAVDDHGKYLTVWEKQKDGSLKIKIDTWNSDVNPWMMGNEGAPNAQKKN
jgi:ketosteroid isomerase-like protein